MESQQETLKKDLFDLIHYFEDMKATVGEPALEQNAERAIALLKKYPALIDANTFGAQAALDLNGDLTKGIGDWAWAEPYASEIGQRINGLFAQYAQIMQV
jgi:hypothetical protein